MTRNEAIKFAIQELGESFGQYLITTTEFRPRTGVPVQEQQRKASLKARQCQEAMQVLRSFL